MSLLFLLLDNSRENYRDAICTVMRQLLRKSFVFVAHAHPFTSCSHIHRGRKVYCMLQAFWIPLSFLCRLHPGTLRRWYKVPFLHYQGGWDIFKYWIYHEYVVGAFWNVDAFFQYLSIYSSEISSRLSVICCTSKVLTNMSLTPDGKASTLWRSQWKTEWDVYYMNQYNWFHIYMRDTDESELLNFAASW